MNKNEMYLVTTIAPLAEGDQVFFFIGFHDDEPNYPEFCMIYRGNDRVKHFETLQAAQEQAARIKKVRGDKIGEIEIIQRQELRGAGYDSDGILGYFKKEVKA
jgi:hypothetical protein